MVNKKILITTYFFYPDNSPRAYRISALAKCLSLKGYEVTVVTNSRYDYEAYTQETGIKVISLSAKPLKCSVKSNNALSLVENNSFIQKAFSKVKTLARKSLLYAIPDGHLFPFALKLNHCLGKLGINDFDVIISNANPFIVHLGTALSLKQFNGVAIAETGDPHYYNHYKLAFYQKNIENWVLNKFNYITVPVRRAVNDYENYNVKHKVSVIPHGFFFDEVQLANYKASNVVNFAFAGRLYKEIRNPTEFLHSLVEHYSETNYVFHIFTDLRNKETKDLLMPFKALLGSKLQVNDMLPRTECIECLSAMDFLINFENDTSNQVPSKLIDYTLAERPILSVNHFFDNDKEFARYMSLDFEHFTPLDISPYNITNVAKKFESLFL
ncbi:MAG: glycosyltransferase family 4 protein [Colwellia sp.]|nr:glycosyltransferase family 4 protein [Colwellia sp.]